MLRGYGALSDALAELETFLQRKNVTAAELIGLAADRRKTFAQMPLMSSVARVRLLVSPLGALAYIVAAGSVE